MDNKLNQLSRALANCITALLEDGVDPEFIKGLLADLDEDEKNEFLAGAGIDVDEE